MRTKMIAAAVLALGLGTAVFAGEEKEEGKPAPPAATDKSGGLYPNDFGPAEIDVSSYPKQFKQSYRTFAFKCAACHTIARVVNSQFLELTEDELKKAKKDEPELFKDEKIVKAEAGIWNRYVKRMMSKPGCPVGKDGKAIWEFLVYDSKVRKTGANAKAWREHRGHLLHEFEEHYGSVYKELFGEAKK